MSAQEKRMPDHQSTMEDKPYKRTFLIDIKIEILYPSIQFLFEFKETEINIRIKILRHQKAGLLLRKKSYSKNDFVRRHTW